MKSLLQTELEAEIGMLFYKLLNLEKYRKIKHSLK